MIRTLIATVFGVALTASMAIAADADSLKQHAPYSIEGVPKITLPGDFGAGFGVEVIGTYRITEALTATGTVGIQYFLEKNDRKALAMPFMAGLRYAIAPNLFVGKEMGIHRWNTEKGGVSDNSFKLMISPQIGYTIMDRYTIIGQFAYTDDFSYTGLRVAIPVFPTWW